MYPKSMPPRWATCATPLFEAEIEEKTALYFDAGAREVWICALSGAMKFLARGGRHPLKTSQLCPKFPKRIELP